MVLGRVKRVLLTESLFSSSALILIQLRRFCLIILDYRYDLILRERIWLVITLCLISKLSNSNIISCLLLFYFYETLLLIPSGWKNQESIIHKNINSRIIPLRLMHFLLHTKFSKSGRVLQRFFFTLSYILWFRFGT